MALFVIKTKDYTFGRDRELYQRGERNHVIDADSYELDENEYVFWGPGGNEAVRVMSIPMENVLFIANKANLATD